MLARLAHLGKKYNFLLRFSMICIVASLLIEGSSLLQLCMYVVLLPILNLIVFLTVVQGVNKCKCK